jgi:hypothetical protein
MLALPASSPPVIVLVAVLCGTLVGLVTALVRALKYLMPNDSPDRVKVWSLWLRYRHRRWLARSDRCRARVDRRSRCRCRRRWHHADEGGQSAIVCMIAANRERAGCVGVGRQGARAGGRSREGRTEAPGWLELLCPPG